MNQSPRVSKGRPVTGEQIDRLAQEAEAGYDVAALRRVGGRKPLGSGPARVVPVRLDPELDDAVKQRAQIDHSTTSDVIRDALRAWLKSA